MAKHTPLSLHSLAVLAVLLATMLFSLQIIVQRLAEIRQVPTVTMVATGLFFIGIILAPFALSPSGLKSLPRAWPGLALLALIRLSAICGYFLALALLPASNAVLLFYLAPLFILAQLAACGKEHIGKTHLLVFILAFAGVVLALDVTAGGSGGSIVVGVLAAVFLSWDYLLTKRCIPAGKSLTYFSISSLFLSLIVLIVAPFVCWLVPALVPPLNADYLLVSLALVPVTLLPRLLWLFAIQLIGASKTSLYSLSEPVFVILLSIAAGWEIFSWEIFFGATMVLCALLLLNFSSRKQSLVTHAITEAEPIKNQVLIEKNPKQK